MQQIVWPELETKPSGLHLRSPALHAWAKQLGCPLPEQPSEFFQGLLLSRGYFNNDEVYSIEGKAELVDVSEEEYEQVAYAHGTISFQPGMSFYFFGGAPNERVFHESKGYFTVRELCRALADSEAGYEGDHSYFEGLHCSRREGADGSVHILQADWGS